MLMKDLNRNAVQIKSKATFNGWPCMHVKEIEAFNPFIETAKILWWIAIYKSLHLIKERV